MSGYFGFRDTSDSDQNFEAQSFVISQLINRLATTSVVRVVKISNAGELAPVGLVDVIPMVNQVDGDGNPIGHGIIHNVPYFRLQGGANAIIIDPQINDVGIAVFCSRDISSVKRTKAVANPGSNRKYDYADALYIGGILNGEPNQFFQFTAEGITLSSPVAININAPNITITGTNVAINGTTATTGALTSNGHDISSTHRHTSSGGTGVGGPPQ